ncbi:MAG: alpha/beta hydrolase [Verrucomicrobia bacterium]|nr:alpha/beta hydrolase [Verrucomicrobiota bacterium]
MSDFMGKRALKGTSDWRIHQIVLDVSQEAVVIEFGFWLNSGRIWADDFQIEIVASDIPTTGVRKKTPPQTPEQRDRFLASYKDFPDEPLNLGFEGESFQFEEFAYKRVGTLDILATVYRPDNDSVCPVVIHIHGGGLVNGTRTISQKFADRFLERGFALVSIDYRLAPETKLPEIIEDVEDAFKWVREKGPKLFRIDPSRIGLHGDSAGSYLALVLGYRASPPPQAIVSNWGYGDLIGEWTTTPLKTHEPVPEAEARSLVGGRPVSNGTQPKTRVQPPGAKNLRISPLTLVAAATLQALKLPHNSTLWTLVSKSRTVSTGLRRRR